MINLTIFPKKTLATTLEHLQHLSKTIGQKHLNTFFAEDDQRFKHFSVQYDEITFDFYINLKCQQMDAHLKLVDQLTTECFSRCGKEDKMNTFCDFAARGNRIIKERTYDHCLVNSL